MPLSRNQKSTLVDHYGDGVAATSNAFLLDFKGVNVPMVTELRARIRESGGSYEVVKNTLALRAIEGQPLAALKEHFQGPTAVAYTSEDPVALAKALSDFAKDAPQVEFKAGLVEGKPVAAEEIAEIARMPPRDVLIAKLLFLLQSPITGLARVLAAVPRDFVVVLDQIRQQKEEGATSG